MDDNKIIELFFKRDESAIEITKRKYSKSIVSIAYRILGRTHECEECENETYLRAWNSIPPTRPNSLLAYLSKIVRNLAINRIRDDRKNISLDTALILDELSEVIPDSKEDISE